MAYTALLGHCSYCGAAVWPQAEYWVVDTILGCQRLCTRCAARDPYAYTAPLAKWQSGEMVPASMRSAPRKRKGKRGGK
jgi:hypothetical protein